MAHIRGVEIGPRLREPKMSVKYVICQPVGFRGRYSAIRGLSFETEQTAREHIAAKFNPNYAKRLHIESRSVEDDTADRMTCQCCGRPILASKGRVAHHGYQRPGHGWQTGSCMGALHAPFEVSRDRLGAMIAALVDYRSRTEALRGRVDAEEVEISLSYSDRSKPRDRMGRYPESSLKVTRATWDAVRAERESLFSQYGWASFETRKRIRLAQLDGEIRHIEMDITAQQARYDGWKQTHEWRDGAWSPIITEEAGR